MTRKMRFACDTHVHLFRANIELGFTGYIRGTYFRQLKRDIAFIFLKTKYIRLRRATTFNTFRVNASSGFLLDEVVKNGLSRAAFPASFLFIF
jgi:hypothetical protein